MQNNVALSPAVPKLTLLNGYRLGQGSPISCRTGGPSATGGAFTDLLVSALRGKKAKKKRWHAESFARVIYTVLTKSCVTLSHLQCKAPGKRGRKPL